MESTETLDERAYEDRYCAFVDILGFSDLVAQIRSGDVSPDSIKNLLREVHEYPSDEYAKLFEGSDFQASSISDAVCISVKPTHAGLAHIIFVLTRLTLHLLWYGYFVRGAVVKGHLYHDNQTVFGEALIRAYQLEKETVRYPRIMITSEVSAEFESFASDSISALELKDMITDADDGPRFLNVLSQFTRDLGLKSPEKRMPTYRTIKEQIQYRLDKSRDNPKHFEKVRWFAIYWNSFTIGHGLGVNISGRTGSTSV